MDTAKCVIRQGQFADLPELTGLYGAFLEETTRDNADVKPNPDLDVERVVTRLVGRRDGTVLVATAGEDVVGFACVDFRRGTDRPSGLWGCLTEFFTRKRRSLPVLMPSTGYLAHLFVAKPWRRRGIGQALVLAARDWTRMSGAAVLDLNVLATNTPARRLYEKIGMTELLVQYRMRVEKGDGPSS